MLDIQLDKNGDLAVSETGDIFMTQSVKQAVLIRLRWIYNEWRLGPEKIGGHVPWSTCRIRGQIVGVTSLLPLVDSED